MLIKHTASSLYGFLRRERAKLDDDQRRVFRKMLWRDSELWDDPNNPKRYQSR